MCCSIIALLFLGPRVGLLVWWLLPSGRAQFTQAFDSLIMPILGIIFLPWTTIAWTLFSGNGIAGFDWVWVVGGLVIDILSYTSGALKRRDMPGYPSSAP